MTVRIERRVVLEDKDGDSIDIIWDHDQAEFVIEASAVLRVTASELLDFADLIKSTYSDHDPF